MSPGLIKAFKSHPVEIPVYRDGDIGSLDEVPDSYAWIQPENFPPAADHNLTTSEDVPLVDLSLPNAAQLVGNAFRTWGACQVINHGISTALFDNLQNIVTNLFSLPEHQKLKAARTREDGISGYGLVRMASFFPKRMWNEGFTIVESPAEHFSKLWPNEYTKYCEVIEEYDRELKSLCGRMMWLALVDLGVTREDVKWAGPDGDFKIGHRAIRMNSYPVCPDPARAMGLGPHTDTCLITVLYQNHTRGLQVLREGNRWVTVDPVPGGLVVQVGDLLHIMSNGLYPSSLHQAVVNQTRVRQTVAYVFGPPDSAEISPLKKLLGPTQPPLYRTVTWREYLATKAKHFNNALSSIRLCAPITGQLELNDHSQVKVG